MSTNFYLKRIPIANDKVQAIKLISEDKIDEAIEFLTQLSKRCEIHIGKRSCGWQFAFDTKIGNTKFNRNSVNEYLSLDRFVIVDEYGYEMSVDEFWEMVDDWNNSETNWRTNNKNDDAIWYKKRFFIEDENFNRFNAEHGEFSNDGLRFLTYKEWS